MSRNAVEKVHAGAFVTWEAPDLRAREAGTLAAGEKLDPGTVLGQLVSTGEYVQLSPGSSNGAENAVAILYYPADATDAAAECIVIARDATVNGHELTWPDGISAPDKSIAIAQLKTLGIQVR